ncbi:Helicase conserved C-terminal domain-containing protein [Halogranum gelatinilyticum]|uniref:Helicase conserved C-terminal domain-containing protein n=1 Tax=Halogranum gelatinilyticum TaxID=660521 RepID=A0A1G9Z2R3_9EURY|nr:SNF2-related protein [Halogranum gelatinilyticum]SDN15003.1 Helicase conserved C-terminal domain-containing protein [Halogranum gelatinilyticum]
MVDDLVDVELRHEDTDLTDCLADASSLDDHLLTVQANRLKAGQPDTELRSLSHLDEENVKLLEHQVNAAHRALFEMDGKALLADEVGLGKTIEVGMILKEMHYRGTDDAVLILTPAQLAQQWQAEMLEKFGLKFKCNYDDDFEGFNAHDHIIASIDTAKSESNRSTVLARDWDVLVLDEAHYVKNEDTDRYDLLQKLSYDYAFFLTATPIQNDVTDLYNIVSLLRPGLFGTREAFHHYFINRSQEKLVNRNELQKRLRKVMIRNRREDTDIDFTPRRVTTRTFEPSPAERDLYQSVTDYVRTAYSEGGGQKLVLMTLQKEVVSSPAALRQTVEKQLDEGKQPAHTDQLEQILERVDAIETPTKLDRVQNITAEARERVDKGRVIVFTQFRATQQAILNRLDEAGYTTHPFHGGHTSDQKEEIVERFEEEGGVLVSTDAMNEGRNLQFCNVMVNYDLPWNPMKVEQRIGRIHRIGQDREVYVFNIALEDTIEEYVLERLYHKIDLFQQSVGELSEILTRLEETGRNFEDDVFERLVNAGSEVELENDFDAMAIDLQEQRDLADKLNDFNNGVFEGFDLGDSDD